MTVIPLAGHIGVFDLFTIGIGPSSSHTVGPMRAAADFVDRFGPDAAEIVRVEVELFGSLAATGRGHGTMTAVLLGLEGCRPDSIAVDEIDERLAAAAASGRIRVGGLAEVAFGVDDIVLRPLTVHPRHPNAMRLVAHATDGRLLDDATYFSVGGGFIEREGETAGIVVGDASRLVPHDFGTADELVATCERESVSIAELAMRNETVQATEADVRARVLHLRDAMHECVESGLRRDGTLPGGLGVVRRAPALHAHLLEHDPDRDPADALDWVNLVALAVNEENAAGGRVVTAPTNGAAGILPAVLHYASTYTPRARRGDDLDDLAVEFLLTAAAIGGIVKRRASISGAEVGCQGEVGSASSMAAAALAAVLGGTPAQVENAAEIAMEHSLGLTCDPVGGLVQIPCIERNAIAAGKAINAAKMAMWGDGSHRVSFDTVVETMRQTGRDMSEKYKETAMGGLAVNVVEC
ncbi:L-serine dehydratase [Agromyces sp. CF514]|uniref:L-serine ammonia-lyase n=1 Tax=Agromyces sp. CF514 TaxID=1881031 RepID=UPI0008EB7088|nr:L-serine ammonia-lyase [Agromyces sp. CF514]SFR74279.1 L-serine dehydratase [Agromyces sp. CF514]